MLHRILQQNRKCYTFYLLAFILCISGEIGLYTIWRNEFGLHLSPLLLALFGIGTGISFLLILFAGAKKTFLPVSATTATVKKKTYRYLYLLLLPLLIYWYIELSKMYHSLPIDFNADPSKTGSDVIPNVMSYVKRVLNGEYPYQMIWGEKWRYFLAPTYLTMMWLPYLPAEIFGFDYRWIPVIALTVSLFIYHRNASTLRNNPLFFGIAYITPLVFLYLHTRFNSHEIKLTVEGLVTAYYMLLAFTIGNKKYKGIVLMLLCCILSRFSLIFWLPLLLLVIFNEYGKAYIYKTITVIAVGIALLYGIFMIKDPLIFIKAMKYYSSATVGEWTVADWIKAEGGHYPYSLSKGTGLAIWFYDYLPGTLEIKIATLKKIQLVIVSSATLIMCLHYWKYKTKIDGWLYALGGLKLSLVLFYSFVQIPYTYLFMLPVFLNLPLLLFGLKIMNGNFQVAPLKLWKRDSKTT